MRPAKAARLDAILYFRRFFFMVILARSDDVRVWYDLCGIPRTVALRQVAVVVFRAFEPTWFPTAVCGRGEMSFWRSTTLFRIGVGAALLLLTQVLCAPRTAEAGCNHLVSSNSPSYVSLAHLDELITGQTPGPLSDSGGPKGPPPCSGPSCSGRVPLPISTVLPSVHGLDQWCLLADLLDLTGPPAHFAWMIETPTLPSSDPSLVFHPPRSLA
jgi:hypothetical protein